MATMTDFLNHCECCSRHVHSCFFVWVQEATSEDGSVRGQKSWFIICCGPRPEIWHGRTPSMQACLTDTLACLEIVEERLNQWNYSTCVLPQNKCRQCGLLSACLTMKWYWPVQSSGKHRRSLPCTSSNAVSATADRLLPASHTADTHMI